MIEMLLMRRREEALADWIYDQKCARLLAGTPLANHADRAALSSRRRLRRADLVLDLWTYRRRHASSDAGAS